MSLLSPNPKAKLSQLTGKTDFGALYLVCSLQTLPRILNLLDRYPDSPTYGCCDPYYWKYQLLDVANARFQEAAWLMALAYTTEHPLNRYYGNPVLKEWALAAVAFHLSHQHRDGSVSEVYPNERSFCATAFSTWAIAETLYALRQEVDITSLLPDLIRSGQWLLTHQNPDVANQMAASMMALQLLWTLTDDLEFAKGASQRMHWLMDHQDKSGYYPEYGGCDYGYQSITLGAIARSLELMPSDDLLESFRLGFFLMDSVVDDFGFYPFEDTSRQTQYLYPSGFAFAGSPIIHRHLNGLQQDLVLNPTWMDDRYSIAMAIDYWLAYALLNKESA